MLLMFSQSFWNFSNQYTWAPRLKHPKTDKRQISKIARRIEVRVFQKFQLIHRVPSIIYFTLVTQN